jgi:hypothetical protein
MPTRSILFALVRQQSRHIAHLASSDIGHIFRVVTQGVYLVVSLLVLKQSYLCTWCARRGVCMIGQYKFDVVQVAELAELHECKTESAHL